MSEVGEEQIVVDLPSSKPTPPAITDHVQQAGAGPSIRRQNRSSDVKVEGNHTGPEGNIDGNDGNGSVPTGPQYIQPDHFYSLNNHANPGTASRGIPQPGDGWLSPEDDPQCLRGIPVFKPSLEEFEDFEGYAKKTVPWGQYSGIVKIVPPSSWSSTVPPIPKSSLADVSIRAPIQQNFLGQAGLFRIANVVKNKNRPLSVKEWFEKSNDKKFKGPGPKDGDRTTNRDSKEAMERREKIREEMRKAKLQRAEKRKAAEQRKSERARAATHKEEVAVSERANGTESVQDREDASIAEIDPVPPLDPSHHSPHSSPDPIATTPDSNPIDPWYKSFNPTENWLPENTKPEDYTPEACAVLERQFWKNMGLSEPSWYGADMEGSLFVDEKTPWNVAHLPNLLNRWDLTNLPGVNTPYLYFGMWGASFAWHVEDMDLFSINYIHFGAPKFWYAIPQLQAEKFERILQGYFPEEARNCDQFLRHKSFAVSPWRLANDGVNVNMLVHNQGEFVITYPRGYHAGFNMGFNCAESVNFALESWVELGRRAKACECVSHSVRIDVDEMLAKEERRLKGEQELLEAIAEERRTKKPRKRQTLEGSDGPRKRARITEDVEISEADLSLEVDDSTFDAETKPKIQVMRKKKPKEVIDLNPGQPKSKPAIVKENPVYPCLLCPGMEVEDLLPVWEPPESVKAIWRPRTDEIRAHHSCALAMPGVGIEDREVAGVVKTYVVGAENIENARWNLKCAACSDKKLQKTGAKIQCTKGKCPKAFHVSCAKTDDATSLKIWEVEVPLLPAEGEEPLLAGADIPIVKDIKVELLCPQHNPDMKEKLEQKKTEAFRQKVMAISPGSRIKLKTRGGASTEYTLVDTRTDTQEVLVQDDAGVEALFPWSGIDFRPTQTKLLENEYARPHYTHVRRSDYKSVGLSQQNGIYPGGSPSGRRSLVQPPAHVGNSFDGDRAYAPPKVHTAPLRVNDLLNPSSDQIPSRVVLVESSYGTDRREGRARVTHLPPSSELFYNGYGGSPYPPPTYHAISPSNGYLSQTGQHAVQPYDSRHPLNPPLHPYGHSSKPYNLVPRSLGLSDQPPPLQMTNGYHAVLPRFNGRHPSISHSSNHMAGGNSVSGQYESLSQAYLPTQPGPTRLNGNGHVAPSANGVGKIDLGLARMQAIMNSIRPVSVPAIHLAGTNGKGSVSAILESCLRAAGLSVARYNSPHLIEPRDAIRIDGHPPSRESYTAAIDFIQQVNRHAGLSATTFEIATAAAYHLINSAQPQVDVMIIECGLGGAKDATNIIPPEITLASALTSVGLDHTTFLGNSITEIAQEKSKIVVPGGLLIVGPQAYPEAVSAAAHIAAEKGARVIEALKSEVMAYDHLRVSLEPFRRPGPTFVRTPFPLAFDSPSIAKGILPTLETELNMGGKHQLDNLSLALTILHTIRLDPRARRIQPKLAVLSDVAIKEGVKHCEWAGRCSWLEWTDSATGKHLPILVDGAHNEDSAATLREYIDSLNIIPRPKVRFIISLSASPGKTVESVLAPLLREGDEVEIVQFTTPVEGMPWIKPVPQEEAAQVASKLVGANGRVAIGDHGVLGVERALKSAIDPGKAEEKRLTVCCGSLYLVADVYRLLGRTG
ncbi:hypothetical protein CI109_101189 [Kwoniella shandongensis]|uniref:Uncharacterized protein n=1 Tax=Kwoniella shandongensis TaxID=1734106 RepID=A0A5M6BXP8_9TREE|nr:uncharacterized protein CI109_005493 [Kwoniella shandongensis]KAA5526215.1 hypothetical protein CI109_005493 [Kwoniella shandongensis]